MRRIETARRDSELSAVLLTIEEEHECRSTARALGSAGDGDISFLIGPADGDTSSTLSVEGVTTNKCTQTEK